MLVDPGDKNDVFVIHRFPALEAAQGYANSSELRDAMHRADVTGARLIETAVERLS